MPINNDCAEYSLFDILSSILTTIFMNNLHMALTAYGLNEKEIALYIASLGLGEATMSELAIVAKIKRSTAYITFKSLADKGLMGSYKMKNGIRVVASSPEALLSLGKKKIAEIEAIVPQLKALTATPNHKPMITYYEGVEGAITAIEGSLHEPHTTLRSIGSLEEIHKVYQDYDLKHFIPTRIRQKIFIRCLYFPDISERIKTADHERELREIRYLPLKYKHKHSLLIYGNKVIVISGMKDIVAVVIENADIADGERAKFDLMWDSVGLGGSKV